MTLKATNKIGSSKEERIIKLLDEISDINKQIFDLQVAREEMKNTILAIKIAPFKVGDYVMFNCPSGRTRKLQKCLLECEDGLLYARPVKGDDELSSRRFLVAPIGKDYQDVLQEVKE